MAQPGLRHAVQSLKPVRTLGDPSAFFGRPRNLSTFHHARVSISRPSLSLCTPRNPQKRLLSSTSTLNATVVLKNPRTDEDGKDMTVEISDRAAKRLKQITTSPPQKNTLVSSPSSASDSHLRVTVTSGGCHGFQYLMSLEGPSKIDAEEDTIFSAGDSGSGDGQAVVVMDEPSLELLKGSTIDFTQELIGSQFKIVGNPRAKSSCGCGTSFDIE